MNRPYVTYDVIVVGAGPSGTILSYLLAQNGINVLLLEKDRLPRYKACGGGINLRTVQLIPFDITEIVENTIYGAMVSHKNGPPILRTYHKPLTYMVMRDKFDYFLVRQAQAAGVNIIDQCRVLSVDTKVERVIVQTTMSEFTANIVVGADGANSVVARSSGLVQKGKRSIGIDCQLMVDDQSRAKWEGIVGLEFGRIYEGYSWIFPKKDCLSVGIAGPDKYANYLKTRLFHFIEKQRFRYYEIQSIRGHALPHGYHSGSLTTSRSILLGDAAGLVDPLTGDGIYFAIKSALLAAPIIMKSITDGKVALAEYKQVVNNELVPELKMGNSLSILVGRFPRLFVYLLTKRDRVWNFFCRVLRGETTYTNLKRKLGPLNFILPT